MTDTPEESTAAGADAPPPTETSPHGATHTAAGATASAAAADAHAGPDGASAVGPDANGDGDVRPKIRAGNEDFYVEARGDLTDKDVAGYVPSPESDLLRVNLEQFEGPFDLLLHLIDKHTFDIFDIPIKKIVAEYMRVLDDMRDLNLDVAGEFLVMAAQLAHIKSKMLLPREERPREAAPELDPRAELVRRLLEYQRFKDAAFRLDQLTMLGRDVFARPYTPIEYDGHVELPVEDIKTALNLADIDVFDLIRLLDQMLKKQQKLVVHEVLVERISVGARINEIVDLLTSKQDALDIGYSFYELCEKFVRTKRSIIVTFLSILEMTRLKLVKIGQADDGSIAVMPVLENLRAEDDMSKALSSVDEFEKPDENAGDGVENAT